MTTRTVEQPTLAIGTGHEPLAEVRKTVYLPCWHCGQLVADRCPRCGWCGAKEPTARPPCE